MGPGFRQDDGNGVPAIAVAPSTPNISVKHDGDDA